MPDPKVAMLVRHALDEASALLADPGCRTLLDEYRDRLGRPLTAGLRDLNVDVQGYLRLVVFYDGSQYPGCGNTLAYTIPGSRAVGICAGAAERSTRHYLAVSVIHELLHSLGLREDPPSSAEISDRIQARCRAHAS